jgi:hypothetical protein
MSGSLSKYRPTVQEAQSVFALLCKAFKGSLHAAGSLYRNWDYPLERVGDIDVILCETAQEHDANTETLAALFGRHKNGNVRTMGVFGRIQVDFFRCDPDTVGAVSLFYCLPRPVQLAARCLANVRGFRFGPKGLIRLACNPHNQSGEEELLKCSSKWRVAEFIGMSQLSREELRRGAQYVYKEELNKPG